MASSEKFCLRWNDFESNVSSAFRDIREEKDFFDVTLACDDDSQIQAHKVIIAACSPFFRNILRKNSHPSPLLYLKGVKYKELVSVLNFMYMGEVNVAQDDLNSFLAVAEDLRVKGLTQGSGSGPSDKQKSEPSKYPPVRPRDSQMPSEPPAKKSRAVAPEAPSYDDDIQEVLPVKSEPGAGPTAGASHYDVSQDQNQVALDDQYDESYDYGQYGEGYDDGSGMIDPNTGLPLQTADGNKGFEDVDLEELIRNTFDNWECVQCGKIAKTKQHIKSHVETHLIGVRHHCKFCLKSFKTTNSLSKHISQYHR